MRKVDAAVETVSDRECTFGLVGAWACEMRKAELEDDGANVIPDMDMDWRRDLMVESSRESSSWDVLRS